MAPDSVVTNAALATPIGGGVGITKASSTNTTAQQPAAREAAVTIHAVESSTKEPLPDVEIIAHFEKSSVSGITDTRGEYRIRLPESDPSNLWVQARKDGFVPVAVQWDAVAESFEWPREFTFRPKRSAPIGGIVQDERGRPIYHADVAISQFDPYALDEAGEQTHVIKQDVHLDVGSFRFEDVVSGTYHLKVTAFAVWEDPRAIAGSLISKATREATVSPASDGSTDEPLDLGDIEVQRPTSP